MLAQPSGYARVAAKLRDGGYHPLPTMPGAKVPGQFVDERWRPMSRWSDWCERMPPEFMHARWSDWPDAGVCIAHGDVVGLDVDTDRKDVSAAALAAAGPSPVRRRGSKGWMGYYRPGSATEGHTARLRWYDGDGVICVELLLHGTQSVLPPTIHPETGQQYRWLTDISLEDTELRELPELPIDAVARLDQEFGKIGLARKAPAMVRADMSAQADGHDLEKPFCRSLNDRAMRAIDAWWPALNMPKSRQRGPGAWEAVPFWRSSNSGRDICNRNPNLKAIPTGIVDFGADRSYTALNVVMNARECSLPAAIEWLQQFVEPEPGMTLSEAREIVAAICEEEVPATQKTTATTQDPSALKRLLARGLGEALAIPSPGMVSEAEMMAAFPLEDPPFPVQDFRRDLTGTLRDMTICIDGMASMQSERGAFSAALALMSVLLGRKIETVTGLRTNLYVLATAESGAGKSSAMNAMHTLATELGIDDRIGASDFTSGAAILQELAAGTPTLLSIDEIGEVVQRAVHPRAASHERDIGRILKDIFSSANSVYRGKAMASGRRPDLMQPHLSLYGVSTHEAFWEGVSGSSFRDGLLARFLLIPIGNTRPQTPRHERFDEVLEGVRAIANYVHPGNLGGLATPVEIKMAPDIFNRWIADRHEWQRYCRRAEAMGRPGAPAIINRIHEMSIKIAMISAAGRSLEIAEIASDDYDLGSAVAHWSAISLINAIARYHVENAQHKDLKRVLEYIEASGAAGRTKTQITRNFQGIFAKGREGDNILAAILGGGNAAKFMVPTSRRPREMYVASRHAEAFALANGIGDD